MPVLVTTFEAASPDEEQLNNLTLWLEQTEFAGFEDVEYRFAYARTVIRCNGPELPAGRLAAPCSLIDDALQRIVSDLAPNTRRSA